jgi:D-alanyl-D-alanine carboxypeptidase (penicillin-binding protein 5/6)
MLTTRRLPTTLLLGGFLAFAAAAAAAQRSAPTRPSQAAVPDAQAFQGAIALDAATGTVLFEDRADHVGPPASVAKLMTFLLVHDRLARGDLSLQTPVFVNAEAAKTGGSQVYLAEKETFPVEEMLFALMIASANDAATALAIHVAGSRPAFVELMNARARELGMTNTTFRSPHGLPPSSRLPADGDLTTPRDLARLSLHLLRTTNILAYTSVRQRVFRPGPKRIDMTNHNNLLGRVAGVDGLKTGFTRGAGFCLATTALRHGRRVIVVTMGSPDSKTRDIKTVELLERTFSALPPFVAPPAASGSPVQPAPRTAAPPPPPAPAPTEPVIKFSIPKR